MNLVPKAVQRWLQTSEVVNEQSPIGPNTRRFAISPSDWFVDAQRGSATADGRSPDAPLLTVAGALAKCSSGDTIYVVGNITEEIVGDNLLEDISIIGQANRARHADKARDYATFPTYKGISGCSWRQAAAHGATTPLLKIRGQGWHIENILFVPPSDAAAIYLDRNALSNISEFDASHAEIVNCRFAGGQSGIEDAAGTFNVNVRGCTFQGSTNGIKGLGEAVALPLQWVVEDCNFIGNTNHLLASASKWVIRRNVFGVFTTISIKLSSNQAGLSNVLYLNYFYGTYSHAGGYTEGAATDEWGGNANSIAGGWTAADPA